MAKIEKDVNLLDRDTQDALAIFMDVCNNQLGLNLKVTETYRTAARQKELYDQGRSTPGEKVTNCDGVKNISIHQTRRAFDVCHNVRGKEYDKAILTKAGKVGEDIGLTWGGSWGWDSPHFELPKGKKPKDIREDKKHIEAVNKLSKKINIDPKLWYNINLKNVPALIDRMGGFDALAAKGIIGDRLLWSAGKYKESHVKALIEKASRLL